MPGRYAPRLLALRRCPLCYSAKRRRHRAQPHRCTSLYGASHMRPLAATTSPGEEAQQSGLHDRCAAQKAHSLQTMGGAGALGACIVETWGTFAMRSNLLCWIYDDLLLPFRRRAQVEGAPSRALRWLPCLQIPGGHQGTPARFAAVLLVLRPGPGRPSSRSLAGSILWRHGHQGHLLSSHPAQIITLPRKLRRYSALRQEPSEEQLKHLRAPSFGTKASSTDSAIHSHAALLQPLRGQELLSGKSTAALS